MNKKMVTIFQPIVLDCWSNFRPIVGDTDSNFVYDEKDDSACNIFLLKFEKLYKRCFPN